MPPDWRTARLPTSRFWTPAEGRLKHARWPKPWAAGRSVRLAFSVILLSDDAARAGAARARPEVACPELKKSQADCKVGLPLSSSLDASDHPARRSTIIPERTPKDCGANPIGRLGDEITAPGNQARRHYEGIVAELERQLHRAWA